MTAANFMLLGVGVAAFVAIAGLLSIFYLIFNDRHVSSENTRTVRTTSASILAVVGSGGHTTEILSLMKHLGEHYEPRYYVMANTDKMSEEKVVTFESTQTNKYEIHKIPRSREVKQSWITTVLSTVHAALYAFPLVFKLQPELILCNGPGTCIPICVAGIILKIFLRPLKIVYVESICRVESLSLSGKILYHFADEMVVHWPQLQKKYPKTKYLGRLV